MGKRHALVAPLVLGLVLALAAPALCLNYGYDASRVTFAADQTAALPVALALLAVAVVGFSVARGAA